ncbi:MAG: hypothetical protein ACXVP3_02425 [Actinomycetota bacterium]
MPDRRSRARIPIGCRCLPGLAAAWTSHIANRTLSRMHHTVALFRHGCFWRVRPQHFTP